MPGAFSPPATSKETTSKRSLHASRHVRHARAVMHVGIANQRGRCGVSVPGIPGVCATRNCLICQEAHSVIKILLLFWQGTTFFLQNVVQNGIECGIVRFSATAETLQGIIEMTDNTRQQLIDAVPTVVGGYTSIGSGM